MCINTIFHKSNRIKQDLGSLASNSTEHHFSFVIKIKFIFCVAANLVERGPSFTFLFNFGPSFFF